jgi:hypothetical protein
MAAKGKRQAETSLNTKAKKISKIDQHVEKVSLLLCLFYFTLFIFRFVYLVR